MLLWLLISTSIKALVCFFSTFVVFFLWPGTKKKWSSIKKRKLYSRCKFVHFVRRIKYDMFLGRVWKQSLDITIHQKPEAILQFYCECSSGFLCCCCYTLSTKELYFFISRFELWRTWEEWKNHLTKLRNNNVMNVKFNKL